jgi:hypothetical protein
VQVLEVAPPEGWRPANEEGIDVFITLCYGSDCASSDDPGALEELKKKHENDTDAGIGGPGKDTPDGEPELPYPSVPGVYSEDVKAFIDFTIDMIEQTLLNKNAEPLTPDDLLTAKQKIFDAIANGEVSIEAIQTVADMANGKLEGGTMFVFLKGTAVFNDSGHVAFGVMTPDGKSLLGSVSGKNSSGAIDYFNVNQSIEEMFQWAHEGGYTRVYTKSVENYDYNAALVEAVHKIKTDYNLASDNCAHATYDVLEAFTIEGPNDIRDYGPIEAPLEYFPQTWSKQLEEQDDWVEIPLFKSDGTVRSNDNMYIPTCYGLYCTVQKIDPNQE